MTRVVYDCEEENLWGYSLFSQGNGIASTHFCYFCRPEFYPEMEAEHTLCSRCAKLIYTPGLDDPMNMAMSICQRCTDDLAREEKDEV